MLAVFALSYEADGCNHEKRISSALHVIIQLTLQRPVVNIKLKLK